jgi:hypothetical protein
MKKILFSNWINIVGILVVLFCYTFLNSLINFQATFIQAFIGAFLLICLYGIIFWLGFLILIFILDLILIIPTKKSLKIGLLIEWLIISTPFIYWAVIYKEQRVLYIIAIIAFLISQMIREKWLNKN